MLSESSSYFSSLGISVSLPYLIYKCLVGLVLFAHMFLKIEQWPGFGAYFVYATHWGQIIMTRFFQQPIFLLYIIMVQLSEGYVNLIIYPNWRFLKSLILFKIKRVNNSSRSNLLKLNVIKKKRLLEKPIYNKCLLFGYHPILGPVYKNEKWLSI